ncbi:branched-chain amino acid ABC transporter permease [Candidatus Bathyarchaeota archaeon]|nr:branched-chain amino acid ABC transporter permease [Candidatus Bathyarchaeota archaeon]
MFDISSFLISWFPLFGIYAVLSLCLNLEVGYAGMANFGLVAFYGIGAFVAGYTSITIFLTFYGYNYPIYSPEAIIAMGRVAGKTPWLNISVFILSLILAFLIAGLAGYLVSYPTLRVGPAFLGITILSFGEMLRVFMKHFAPTGGAYGMLGIPHPFAWIPDPAIKNTSFLILTLAILIGVLIYFELLVNSPYGRVLKSIREDETASLCIGKPVPQIKARLLFVASGISGVAGALYAFYLGAITPDMFITAVTFEVWSMVILGGRGNNFGALLGASVFSLLNRATSILNFLFSDLPIDPNYFRWMITGALIVIILMYKPKGIIAEKPIKTEAWKIFGAYGETKKKLIDSILRIIDYLKSAIYWLIGRETGYGPDIKGSKRE